MRTRCRFKGLALIRWILRDPVFCVRMDFAQQPAGARIAGQFVEGIKGDLERCFCNQRPIGRLAVTVNRTGHGDDDPTIVEPRAEMG